MVPAGLLNTAENSAVSDLALIPGEVPLRDAEGNNDLAQGNDVLASPEVCKQQKPPSIGLVLIVAEAGVTDPDSTEGFTGILAHLASRVAVETAVSRFDRITHGGQMDGVIHPQNHEDNKPCTLNDWEKDDDRHGSDTLGGLLHHSQGQLNAATKVAHEQEPDAGGGKSNVAKVGHGVLLTLPQEDSRSSQVKCARE